MLLIALVAGLAFGPATPAKDACTPSQTRALISRFVTAFNRGNVGTLNQLWDAKDWFKWYSVGNAPRMRTNAEAYNRSRLIPYFAARHQAHERWVLTSTKINGYSVGYRNFEYLLTRSADDLPGGPRRYVGKGATSCFNGKLAVWSMAERS